MPDFEQLTAGESNARAYVRVPDGARAGVVVLHAWWGLNDDVLAYADRLADAGFAVVAPDMFNGQSLPRSKTQSGCPGRATKEPTIAFAAVDRPRRAARARSSAGRARLSCSGRPMRSGTV